MAFGLMVKKWGILTRPLEIKVRNVKRLIVAIGRLHNFCINERLAFQQQGEGEEEEGQERGAAHLEQTFTPRNVDLDCHETVMRVAAAEIEYEEMVASFENPWSYNRDRMAREIESLHLTRPQRSTLFHRQSTTNNSHTHEE